MHKIYRNFLDIFSVFQLEMNLSLLRYCSKTRFTVVIWTMNIEKVHFLITFWPVVDAFFIRRSTLFWVPKWVRTDERTNGRTDGRTDGQTLSKSVSPNISAFGAINMMRFSGVGTKNLVFASFRGHFRELGRAVFAPKACRNREISRVPINFLAWGIYFFWPEVNCNSHFDPRSLWSWGSS